MNPTPKKSIWRAFRVQPFHPTHQFRKDHSIKVMLLERTDELVRYDNGNLSWGVDPVDYFDACWEPIQRKRKGLLGRFQKGRSSSGS